MLCVIVVNMIAFSGLKAQAQANDKTTAKAFVQGFYDWYVPLYNKFVPGKPNQIPSEKLALTRKKDCFDTKLFNALYGYYNTPTPKGAEDVLGIDMDPFLAAQDNGASYTVTQVKSKGNNFLLSITTEPDYQPKGAKSKANSPVIVEVTKVNGHWKLTDLWYDNGTDIFDLITAYNKDVKATLALKH